MSEDTFHLGIKALIRNSAGNILLLQVNPAKLKGTSKDYWDLPGGRIQKGDDITDTLKREVYEETGIDNIKTTKEIGMVMSNIRIPVGNDTVGLILGIYDCSVVGASVITISDEHIAYEWFTSQEAASLLAVKYPKSFCELLTSL